MEGADVDSNALNCATGDVTDATSEATQSLNAEPVNGDPSHPEKTAEKSDNKKRKRKEDKSYEYILRALSSLNSPEEKLAALCRKYADLNEETRTLKDKCRTSQKLITQITREKEQLQNEHGKVVLAKDRLENLCREFQKQNKLISDESVNRAKDAEEKRKEVNNKFQTTLTEIRHQMGEYHTMNDKLRDENRKLSDKLKSLIDQYEQREQQMDKMYKTKELEHQLAEAKLEHATCAMKEEKARGEQERLVLMEEREKSRERITFLENREKVLKGEIEFYQSKYEEFQDTLTNSNEVFHNFKEEMEKMSRRLRKVEKETVQWKQKFENSNRTAIQLAEEKTKNENEIKLLRTKLSRLEELCRVLQAERRRNVAGHSNLDHSTDTPSCPNSSPSPETQEDIKRDSEAQKESIPENTAAPDNVTEGPDNTAASDNVTEGSDPTAASDNVTEGPDTTAASDNVTEGTDPTGPTTGNEKVTAAPDNVTEGSDPTAVPDNVTEGTDPTGPTTGNEEVTAAPSNLDNSE